MPEPWIMEFASRYDWLEQLWVLVPTAITVPAEKVNAKFKKSRVARTIGQASGSQKLAKIPYTESVAMA